LVFLQYQSKATQSLSPDAEAVFLSAMDVIWTTNRNYWNILDNEIDYGEITTFDNLNTVKITPSNFSRLFCHPVRTERQKIQKQFFEALAQFKQSFSNFLTTEIRKRIFWAQNRGYKSSLAAALEKDGLDLDLFYSCMNSFDDNIGYWHKYFELLSKKMNLNKLEAFDVRSPWFEQKVDIPYHTGAEWIIESLRVISDEYASVAKRALLEENWIDVSFDLEKTSIPTAYQCYSDHPRISINYQNDIQSVSLLAHELGHALHFYYSSKNQPYHLAVPKTFVTEIVANFHQSLLRKYVLKAIKNTDLHKCLLQEELNIFYNYYFYMPLVGKLEEKLHNFVENGNKLNAKIISQLTREIFEVAYGDFVSVNEYTGYIWMSCDMLYMNFYAFQYLTGLAGAQKIENFIESENQEVLKNYMYFVSAGCSENQIDLLKKVGVDFSTPEPITAGFQTLSNRIDLLKSFFE
jgi:oligoendopeptidase F